MKKKNGFTLIELLAVIVILAIIALIATPIVLNLINQARKGAAARSAEGIRKSAQTYYYSNIVEHPDQDSTQKIFDFSTTGEGGYNGEFNFDGKTPSAGTVTIAVDGKVTGTGLIIDGYTCRFGATGSAACEKSSSSNTSTPSVTITEGPTASVEIGNTLILTATTENIDDEIIWESSNPGVATVTNGVVTPVSVGTTTITASAEGSSYAITITVTLPTLASTCPGCQFIYKKTSYAIEGSSQDGTYSSDIPEETTNDYTTLIGEGGHSYFVGIIESETTPGKIGRAFVCRVEEGTAFCLEGNNANKYANPNITILNAIYPSCGASVSNLSAYCLGDSGYTAASSDGNVGVGGDGSACGVTSNGLLGCS